MLYQFSIESDDEWSEVERKLFTAGMAAALKKMLEKQGYCAGALIEYIEPVEFEVEVELEGLEGMETAGNA